MSSSFNSSAEKAEVDALIAQLGSTSAEHEKKVQSGAGDASTHQPSAISERKRVQVRRNSGSTSNTQPVGSPTDVHGHLLQKNAKISKKYNRKSRQGRAPFNGSEAFFIDLFVFQVKVVVSQRRVVVVEVIRGVSLVRNCSKSITKN